VFNRIDKYTAHQRIRGAAILRRSHIIYNNNNINNNNNDNSNNGYNNNNNNDSNINDNHNDDSSNRINNDSGDVDGNSNTYVSTISDNVSNGISISRDIDLSNTNSCDNINTGRSTYVRSSSGDMMSNGNKGYSVHINRENDIMNNNDIDISNDDDVNATNNNNTTSDTKKSKMETIKEIFIKIKTKIFTNTQNSTKAVHTKMKDVTRIILEYVIIFQNNIYKSIDFTIIKLSQLYPYLKAIYKLLVLSQKILYLYGHSTHIHPVLSILGMFHDNCHYICHYYVLFLMPI
jgi:hypothetical protein